MKIISTDLEGVLILEPEVYKDKRGYFFEAYNREVFTHCLENNWEFVQDNFSRSERGVLRGLHYQLSHPQGKLVQVIRGKVFDVVVDIRKSSSSFGKWIGVELSEENNRQLLIPPGFAHGFLVLSEYADFYYKVTNHRSITGERTILWSDPQIGIKWPEHFSIILSPKDSSAPFLKDAEVYP